MIPVPYIDGTDQSYQNTHKCAHTSHLSTFISRTVKYTYFSGLMFLNISFKMNEFVFWARKYTLFGPFLEFRLKFSLFQFHYGFTLALKFTLFFLKKLGCLKSF